MEEKQFRMQRWIVPGGSLQCAIHTDTCILKSKHAFSITPIIFVGSDHFCLNNKERHWSCEFHNFSWDVKMWLSHNRSTIFQEKG